LLFPHEDIPVRGAVANRHSMKRM